MKDDQIKEITSKAIEQLIAALNPRSQWTADQLSGRGRARIRASGVAQPGSAPAFGQSQAQSPESITTDAGLASLFQRTLEENII